MELCVLRLWFQNTHQNIQNFFKWLKDEIVNKKIWFWSRFYTATAIGGRVKLIKQKQEEESRKWILQRLPITLTQVKADNTSDNLLSEIKQIVYWLHWRREITKKLVMI